MRVKNILGKCLAEQTHQRHTRELAETCHDISVGYLRMKATSHKLYLFHGEKIEDLAWDFIADLFERDATGELKIFRDYFAEKKYEELSDDEIFIELRKLVFTKIEDNIFKALGELEPSLRKIIRNLKLAIKNYNPDSDIRLENGWLVCETEMETDLFIIPSEVMQARLCARLHEKMQIPEILGEVVDILKNQREYQKKISVTGLSLIIREVYTHFHSDKFNTIVRPVADHRLFGEEYGKFLNSSVNKIKQSVGQRYVNNQKICTNTLNAYINAARNILDVYNVENLDDNTQFELLKVEIPDLSYDQFRKKHRKKLEYLVKMIRADLAEVYKREEV